MMSEKKKLVLMELDEKTYEDLKNIASQSSRILGNEVILRLEHAVNHFEGFSEELIEKQKTKAEKANRILQVQLQLEVHTKLKTIASSLNIFVKEFSALLLMQSVEDFEFIVSPANAIHKSKSANNKPVN